MAKTTIVVDKSLFLSVIGDSIRNRILEFFIEGREFDYPIKFIAEELGLNRNTLYKFIEELSMQRMLVKSRKIGSSKFYKLNFSNMLTSELTSLFDSILNRKMEEYISKERAPITLDFAKPIIEEAGYQKIYSKWDKVNNNITKGISTA